MSKRNKRGGDRLSELHDSLMLCIFEFLPTRDVVRTTILSKRWKNLWNTVPWLHFVDRRETIDSTKYENFVDGALNSWRGTKITKFTLHIFSNVKNSHVDNWVNFAVEKKVEDLTLYLPFYYRAPRNLSSCSSLRSLSLRNCHIQGNVQLDELKKVEIACLASQQDSIHRVLRGSPRLEELFLTVHSSNINLNINSTSLKKLSYCSVPLNGTNVKIQAANLINVSSLTEASLQISFPRSSYLNYGFREALPKSLLTILLTIKHVESLTLYDWFTEALVHLNEEGRLPSFPNAKLLELKNCSQECIKVLGAIENFPKLRDLVLETTYFSQVMNHAGSWVEFERKNFPKLFLLELRTVVVTWKKGDDSVFPLIQILLKYARNLEKLVFRVKTDEPYSPWKWKFMLSQKLLRMRRSSINAQLIIC